MNATPGSPATPPTDDTELRAAEADARLLRAVGLRLVAWSGGSTLVVLLALGVALYLSVASNLRAQGVAVLEQRAQEIVSFASGPGGPRGNDSPIDFFFGGGGGTFAIVVTPQGDAIGPRQLAIPTGLPDTRAMRVAEIRGRDLRNAEITVRGPGGRTQEVPVRQLTVPVDTAQGRFFVQVVQDRTSEVRTLQSLVFVLVFGGAVVVLVAAGFGLVYARRALVPIRDSLSAQRAALRRQREFAADASHELRTPLTVIRSSVELLRRNPRSPVEEVGDALTDIDAEVSHLANLVDDLLLLARSDSGAISLERVPLHLDDVVADVAAALAKPAADARVRIEVDPAPAPVVGDPARLRQLVSILVDNAIRHSPPEGVVRVVVRPEPGGGATVAVEDQGPGVRPEDRERIFDRFWRAPGAPPGGTGLGLAIGRWIAEHHQGAIAVDDAPTGGARFVVRLPAGSHPPVPASLT
ncbi:MAG TPA: HAMP domain-containing sensor histidine kinase [Candidatus Binatia bacterium]|nr:HAMP domain-containing sensor histidine kinase [Candidatus Binatia bacterium]